MRTFDGAPLAIEPAAHSVPYFSTTGARERPRLLPASWTGEIPAVVGHTRARGESDPHTQHLSMLETVGRCVMCVGERRGRVPRHPRATSPSSIHVRQVPLRLESPEGAACPGPRLSAFRGSSLRETHAHARNPRPHRAFRPLLGSSVAASSSSRREGSVPSSPARSGRPPAGMSTAVGSRPRRRFTGRDIETGASARRVPTGMGPGRPDTPDCGTPRRGGRRGVERSLGSRWSARVPGPGNMKN